MSKGQKYSAMENKVVVFPWSQGRIYMRREKDFCCKVTRSVSCLVGFEMSIECCVEYDQFSLNGLLPSSRESSMVCYGKLKDKNCIL